jgi:hypothetical protein
MAVVASAVACSTASSSSDAAGTAPQAPEVFGAAGYRGLTPGQAKEAALSGGTLAPAPVSTLAGCTAYSYVGGPVPDAARMAKEEAMDAKYKDLNAKADEAEANSKKPGHGSAQESAEAARKISDATQAIVERLDMRIAWSKLFGATGGASFGKDGLQELAAPPGAKTAEGIGAGSTLDELKKAYDAKGLKPGKGDIFQYELPVEGKPGWIYGFSLADGAKVNAFSLANPEMSCA